MVKTVIYLHPYDNNHFCYTIADKINAPIIYIHAKNALIEFDNYDIVGFGVGINTGKNYSQIINFVEKLPNVQNKKAFIFSTNGISSEKRMTKEYKVLLDLLGNKEFSILNNFNADGFNMSSILKCIYEINSENSNFENCDND